MSKELTEKYNTLLLEAKHSDKKRKDIVQKFIMFACEELGIKKCPHVALNRREDFGPKYKSFGYFDLGENKIVVASSNRNLADILRTLAHEMVHYKQKQNDEISLDNATEAGADGSEIENEANSKAGVLLRKFGRNNPDIYE